MSANNGEHVSGEFSSSELDNILLTANDELLNYVRAHANSRTTLLRIMEIRDRDLGRQAQRNGVAGAGVGNLSGLTGGGVPLRRWDPERIGPYVILGRLGAGAMEIGRA